MLFCNCFVGIKYLKILLYIKGFHCSLCSSDGRRVPRHSTCGSPQQNCSHWVQFFPPKPGRQWHWPVNCTRRTLRKLLPEFLGVETSSSPCCSEFPGSFGGHSCRARSLSRCRSSSGLGRTGRRRGPGRSPCRGRRRSRGHSDNVLRCTQTDGFQQKHRCSLGEQNERPINTHSP